MNKFAKFATKIRNLSTDQKEKIMMGSITLGGCVGGVTGLRFGYMRSRNASFGEHLVDSFIGCSLGMITGVTFIVFSPFTFPLTAGVATMRYLYPPQPYTEHARRRTW